MSKPSEAVELIKELDKPSWLKLCYDYSHYDFRDMPMGETLQTALPHLAHVAVKDVVMKNGRIRFVQDKVDASTMKTSSVCSKKVAAAAIFPAR